MILTYDNKQVKCIIKDPNEHQQKHWVNGKFYETSSGGLLNWVYKKGFKNILDIGASIGNHTLFFAGIMGAKVTSIEPYLPSFQHLKENINQNKLTNVALHNVAVGSVEGFVTMKRISENNVGMVQIRPGADVRITKLDNFLSESIDYIKIDVEHSNIDLLLGASKLKQLTPVISIECESSDILNRTDKIMRSYGYKMIPNLKLNHTPTYIWRK